MPPKRTPGTGKIKAYKTESERKRWEQANKISELQSVSWNRLSRSEKEAHLKTYRVICIDSNII